MTAKPLARAKSRLGGNAADRARWASSMLENVLQAAEAATSVVGILLVTADEQLAGLAVRSSSTARVIRSERDAGLRASLELGRRVARDLGIGSSTALVVTDLPLLEPEDLDEVVAQHGEGGRPMFVADRLGTGTTMLVHGREETPPILFGPRSAALHARAGYAPALGALRGLRHDLDDPDDIRAIRVPARSGADALVRTSR